VLKTTARLDLDLLNRNEECELISSKWNSKITFIHQTIKRLRKKHWDYYRRLKKGALKCFLKIGIWFGENEKGFSELNLVFPKCNWFEHSLNDFIVLYI
jgi:hypothetical protein